MDAPSIHTLPPPPSGKTGWPWTQTASAPPDDFPEDAPLPKISIVTPSYNQGQFLEETIRSVLLQGYPNLEYILIDGGSTDDSLEVIHKYAPWLSYWVSEPDRGQAHAINKGFARATGQILAWINSDDYYLPGAFHKVRRCALENPASLWYAGKCHYIGNGEILTTRVKPDEIITKWLFYPRYAQQTVFFRKKLWGQTNKIDETLEYSFDYELLLQFVQYQPFAAWIEDILSCFRIHPETKTSKNQHDFFREDWIIINRYRHLLPTKLDWLKVVMKHREKISNFYLSPSNPYGGNLANKIIKPLFYSPWYLGKLVYYGKVKNLILEFITKNQDKEEGIFV